MSKQKHEYYDISLDIESFSLRGNAAIAGIGAIKFTEDGILDYDNAFHVVVKRATTPNYHICGSTLKWWEKKNKKNSAKYLQNPDEEMNIQDALQALCEYFDHKGYKVWSKGPAFDAAILQNAFDTEVLEMPWSHWNNRCLYTRLDNSKLLGFKKPNHRNNNNHHALEDSIKQALDIIEATQKTKNFKFMR